jgi:hypothetical protein
MSILFISNDINHFIKVIIFVSIHCSSHILSKINGCTVGSEQDLKPPSQKKPLLSRGTEGFEVKLSLKVEPGGSLEAIQSEDFGFPRTRKKTRKKNERGERTFFFSSPLLSARTPIFTRSAAILPFSNFSRFPFSNSSKTIFRP